MIGDLKTETTMIDRFYFPSLEGLRFIAFFLVFLQHLPPAGFLRWFEEFQEKGSIGVDIFFALSAFLLTSLTILEQHSRGQFSFIRFMLRRALRIVPLLYVYVILIFVLSGSVHEIHAWARMAGNLLFIDNFLCWFDGYSQIPSTAHLWTLSYEMQVYPLIPALALLGLRNFGILLRLAVGIIVFAVAARAVFVSAGAIHPLIWVTPFLRPESIIAGVLLACIVRSKRWIGAHDWTIGIVVTVSLAYFLLFPIPHSGAAAIGIYLVVGVLSGGAVWAALRIRPVKAALACAPIVFLGRISYGLYVFHVAAISLVTFFLRGLRLDLSNPLDFAIMTVTALSVTVTLATLSFFILERPFLKLKTRFEFVPSRPV
jgi:peptidoglycan/LPS O-acetylase OafA/YrhL